MLRMIGCGLSFLVLLSAAVFAFHRAQVPEYIGIDFVQFHVTGQHVVNGGDANVYSDDVRAEILESAWRQARAEGSSGKFFHAVNFRHERSWETYSSPFLYAVFGAMGSKDWRQYAETTESQAAPSSGLRPPYPPNSGEKGKSEAYEVEINWYWVVCLGATRVGCMTFGWVLRIPCSTMLFGSVVLVWFSPLRIDMNVANVNQIQFGMVGVLAAILGGEWKGLGWTRWRSKRESADLEAHHAERDGDMGRELVAGIWLGLCLAFKPSLLWCGVMWAGSMRARRSAA